MATLAEGGRITEPVVADELARLRGALARTKSNSNQANPELIARALGPERAARLDRFDRVQLEDVLAVCVSARSLSEAGRELFASSRAERTSVNDADRLRKYLSRFDLEFAKLKRS
jgi:transcriptional regulatory protein RtcR